MISIKCLLYFFPTCNPKLPIGRTEIPMFNLIFKENRDNVEIERWTKAINIKWGKSTLKPSSEQLFHQVIVFYNSNCAQKHEKSHKTIILHREAKEIRDIIFKLIKVANFSAFYVRPKIFENLSSLFGTVVN